MSASFFQRIAWSVAIPVLLVGCGDPSGKGGNPSAIDTLSADPSAHPGVMKVGGKLFSIPSPVQTALLIRKLGLDYEKNLVIPASKGDSIMTKSTKALAMGMYGADLAYLTMYRDGQRAVLTLQTIERMGNSLEVGNAFDQPLMERFKKNLNNEDSLLILGSAAYRAADQYLKNNERADISALVLTGGFVESLYLSTASPKALTDQNIADRIGEQKTTLTNLVGLMQEFGDQDGLGSLTAQLKELQALFGGITLTYEFAEPVTEASKKTTYINSASTVSITGDQLKAIAIKVAAIRNSILA